MSATTLTPVLEIDLTTGLATVSQIRCEWRERGRPACPTPAAWMVHGECPVADHDNQLCTPHMAEITEWVASGGETVCRHGLRSQLLSVRPI